MRMQWIVTLPDGTEVKKTGNGHFPSLVGTFLRQHLPDPIANVDMKIAVKVRPANPGLLASYPERTITLQPRAYWSTT